MMRLATQTGQLAWLWQRTDGGPQVPFPAPPKATPVCSADQRQLAYFLGKAIWLGELLHLAAVEVDTPVTRAVFSRDGKTVYALGHEDTGGSTLYAIAVANRKVTVLASHLDAPWLPGAIAVTDDAVILPLATAEPPDDAARQKPHGDRWLKLYRFDLRSHQLRLLQSDDGQDDNDPTVVGNELYWVSARITSSVEVMPIAGGPARTVVSGGGAQLPAWSSDGKRLAFMVGELRLADAPLDLDIASVEIGRDGRPRGEPTALITGNHEDFVPAWSPDGRWIAWHSHRAPHPVSWYAAPGATDDIWVRKADDPSAPEIRVTNDLRETGLVYWSPDGSRLVYATVVPRSSKPYRFELRTSRIDPASGAPSGEQTLALPPEIADPHAVDGSPLSITGPLGADWSPRGDELAVVSTSGQHEGHHDVELWIVRPDGTRPRKIASFRSATLEGGLAWTPDASAVLFGGLDGDRMQIFRVAATGGAPRRISDGAGNLMHPRVSPDGRWIAYSRIETVHAVHHQRLP
jgi:Tol biopolymer transport system component